MRINDSVIKKPPLEVRDHFTINAGMHQLRLGRQTKIMGIINMSPDSFSQDGYPGGAMETAFHTAHKMVIDGADLLDIGGESSRPGAEPVSEKEELTRIIPLIKKLAATLNVAISVDTYKPRVAQKALEAGASIINNIKGTQLDLDLLKIVRDHDAAIVLMHMHGTPKTMQNRISFRDDVIKEILCGLKTSLDKCRKAGLGEDKIIIDPGIGFGKEIRHNLEIINQLGLLKPLKQPILIGTSRKSFIGKILDLDVNGRLNGTLSTVSACILKGAHIVRVHDVKEAKETAAIADAIINENY